MMENETQVKLTTEEIKTADTEANTTTSKSNTNQSRQFPFFSNSKSKNDSGFDFNRFFANFHAKLKGVDTDKKEEQATSLTAEEKFDKEEFKKQTAKEVLKLVYNYVDESSISKKAKDVVLDIIKSSVCAEYGVEIEE